MATQVGNGVYLLSQYISSDSSIVQHESCLLRKFIKGEPKALGAVQIMIGIINFFFGATICSTSFQSPSGYTVVPFWGGLCFIISGSLSIAAEKKANYCLIKSSLRFNILSAVAAGGGIIIYSLEVSYDNFYYRCDLSSQDPSSIDCRRFRDAFTIYHVCILSFLLLLCVLEFCISISTSCFGCRVVCDPERDQPLLIVQNINTQEPRLLPTQTTMMPMPAPMSYGISMIPGTSSSAATLPPPYSYISIPSTGSQA